MLIGNSREVDSRNSKNLDVVTKHQDIDSMYKKWSRTFKGAMHQSFKKVKKKTTINNTIISRLTRIKKLLSYFSKSGKRERLILSENKKVIQEILVKEKDDERQRIITKTTQSLTENNNIFDITSFWKLKKLLFPKHSQTKISVIDEKGTEYYDFKSIMKEYQREFEKRLSPRVMDIDYKELEDSSMKLFKLRLELSKLYCQIDDFIDEEMAQVLKSLKTGNTRDPEGYINELFKYSGADVHNSIRIMLNKIRKKSLPRIWENISIITIYKKKGSKKKLKNHRGIFMTLILSKILEKLIQIRMQPHIDTYSSLFQAGGKKNRSTADNIFLLRSLIDHAAYTRSPIALPLYDFETCLDALWLEDSLNVLWDAGVTNDLFCMIYALNETCSIVVNTPFGQTNSIQIDNLQSVSWILAEFCYNRSPQGPYAGTCTILQETINGFLCPLIVFRKM